MPLVLASACASMGAPPGGPPDDAPPQVVVTTPDSGAVGVQLREISVTFDEVIAEPPRVAGAHGLLQYVVLSPEPENVRVGWHRNRISIAPRGGLRPNTPYRVTILPGIADLRGHRTEAPVSWVFSTGATIPNGAVTGRIFDWLSEQPAQGAMVHAIARPSPTDSVVYVGVSDSTGLFTVGPLPAGTYDVRGFIDANRNRRIDSLEKWSGTQQVAIAAAPRAVELLAIQRDTIPLGISVLQIIDSVSIRITFDKAMDPVQPLQPILVRVQRSDSSELQVVEVLSQQQDAQRRSAAARQTTDSIARARADSIAAADTTRVAPPPPPPPPPPPVTPAPDEPQQPRPSMAAPFTAIVVRLDPSTPIRPNEVVRVTTRGFRSVTGAAQTTSATVTAPPPPAPPPTVPRTSP